MPTLIWFQPAVRTARSISSKSNSNDGSDFATAETEAVKLGAHITSNSFACYGSLDCGDSNFASHFDTPGVTYVAAAGDDGYGVAAPMAFASVVSVGGTLLSKSVRPIVKLSGPTLAAAAPSRGITQALMAARSRLLGAHRQRRGGGGLERRDYYDTYDVPGPFGVLHPARASPRLSSPVHSHLPVTPQNKMAAEASGPLAKRRLKNDLHVIS